MGTVISYYDKDLNTIEFEFADTNLHKKLFIENINKYKYADLC